MAEKGTSPMAPARVENEAVEEYPAPVHKAEVGVIEGNEIENVVPLPTNTKNSSETKAFTSENIASISNTKPEMSNTAPISSDRGSPNWARLLRSGYVSPRTKRGLESAGWYGSITPLTSSNEIFETLMTASFAPQRKNIILQTLDRNQEREPVLVFDGLHLMNIQRLQLRLLDISRGCANPPVTNDDEIHLLLHQYRKS